MGSLEETSFQLPAGSWDCHHHIFEPQTFAYSPTRHLTPPAATVEHYLAFKARYGIEKSVLTHGLSYGSDTSSILAFIDALGGNKTTLGIGVIDPETTTDEYLAQQRKAGVRGIRVNLYQYGALEDVERQIVVVRTHAQILKAACPGWSMTFTTTKPENWAKLRGFVESELAPANIQLVTDHFALLKGSSMLDEDQADITQQPGFKDITALLRSSNLWIKLSAPYRVSELGPGYADLQPLVRALVDANPKRVIWGSDWPHTPRMRVRTHEEGLKETPFLEVDDGMWLKTLRSWVSDEEWHSIMVKNPQELFNSS